MFNEMGQASFIVFLNQRSGILHQPELSTPLGLLVVTDVIGHAVLQPSDPQVRINGQLLPLSRHGHHSHSKHCKDGHWNRFHLHK